MKTMSKVADGTATLTEDRICLIIVTIRMIVTIALSFAVYAGLFAFICWAFDICFAWKKAACVWLVCVFAVNVIRRLR